MLILAYKNRDATTVFHSFHVGSKDAYKMLQDVRESQKSMSHAPPPEKVGRKIGGLFLGRSTDRWP